MFFKSKNSSKVKVDTKIELKGIDDSIFAEIYQYLYTGTCKISEKNYLSLIKASDELGFKELSSSCFEYVVKTQCTPENVLSLLMNGKNGKFGKVKTDDLIQKCEKLIASEAENIFTSKSIHSLDEDLLVSLLKSSQLQIDEEELYFSVLKWGEKKSKEEGKQVKDVLKNVLPHIRLPLISSETLVTKIKPTKYFSHEDYLRALEYQIAPEEAKTNDICFIERGSPSPTWDPKWIHTNCTLEQKNKIINMTTCTCFCTKANSFKVKIHSGATWIMVGFKNKQQKESGRMDTYDYAQGYFIYGGGGLYGSRGSGSNSYGSVNLYGNGNIIGATYNPSKKQINFWFNGKDLGVAFDKVEEKELYPCVSVSGNGKLEIVDKWK